MATYEITGPKGEVYHIDGPDDADPSAVIRQVTGGASQATQPVASETTPQSESLLDYGKDLASATVRPIVKAVTGLPGMAADATMALGNIITGHVPLTINGKPNWSGQADAGAMRLPSQVTNEVLDRYTRAPTGIGKVGEFVNTALLSSRLPFGQSPTQAASEPVASSDLTAAQQQAAAAGKSLGMRMLPGQETGNKALQQLEAKLESSPWTSGPINALKANNQSVLNRTAAQSIGEKADVVDSNVLDRANERLGAVFDNVGDPAKITIVDPAKTKAAIDAIDQDAEGLINGSIRDNALVKRLESLTETGGINGQQLRQLSSKIGKAAYKQMTGNGDRDLGKALYGVKNHVDDLIQNSLSPEEQATYAAARQQYRNLMLLTSRVGIVNPNTGNVAGVSLASKLQQADKSGFLYGRNQSDMYNAARFAQAFKPVVGDSGTSTRSLNASDLLAAHYGIPLNLMSRLYASQVGQRAVKSALATPSLLSNPTPLAGPVIGGLLASQ